MLLYYSVFILYIRHHYNSMAGKTRVSLLMRQNETIKQTKILNDYSLQIKFFYHHIKRKICDLGQKSHKNLTSTPQA